MAQNTSTKPEGVQNTSTKPKGVQNTSTKSEGVQNKSTKPEGVQNKSTKPEGVQNKSTKPEGVQNKSTKPESVLPIYTDEEKKAYYQAHQLEITAGLDDIERRMFCSYLKIRMIKHLIPNLDMPKASHNLVKVYHWINEMVTSSCTVEVELMQLLEESTKKFHQTSIKLNELEIENLTEKEHTLLEFLKAHPETHPLSDKAIASGLNSRVEMYTKSYEQCCETFCKRLEREVEIETKCEEAEKLRSSSSSTQPPSFSSTPPRPLNFSSTPPQQPSSSSTQPPSSSSTQPSSSSTEPPKTSSTAVEPKVFKLKEELFSPRNYVGEPLRKSLLKRRKMRGGSDILNLGMECTKNIFSPGRNHTHKICRKNGRLSENVSEMIKDYIHKGKTFHHMYADYGVSIGIKKLTLRDHFQKLRKIIEFNEKHKPGTTRDIKSGDIPSAHVMGKPFSKQENVKDVQQSSNDTGKKSPNHKIFTPQRPVMGFSLKFSDNIKSRRGKKRGRYCMRKTTEQGGTASFDKRKKKKNASDKDYEVKGKSKNEPIEKVYALRGSSKDKRLKKGCEFKDGAQESITNTLNEKLKTTEIERSTKKIMDDTKKTDSEGSSDMNVDKVKLQDVVKEKNTEGSSTSTPENVVMNHLDEGSLKSKTLGMRKHKILKKIFSNVSFRSVKKNSKVGRPKNKIINTNTYPTISKFCDLPMNTPIKVNQKNPKRFKSKAWIRYNNYMKAKTKGELYKLGGADDFNHDKLKGFITILEKK